MTNEEEAMMRAGFEIIKTLGELAGSIESHALALPENDVITSTIDWYVNLSIEQDLPDQHVFDFIRTAAGAVYLIRADLQDMADAQHEGLEE